MIVRWSCVCQTHDCERSLCFWRNGHVEWATLYNRTLKPLQKSAFSKNSRFYKKTFIWHFSHSSITCINIFHILYMSVKGQVSLRQFPQNMASSELNITASSLTEVHTCLILNKKQNSGEKSMQLKHLENIFLFVLRINKAYFLRTIS